ncbi:PspC domain-containing protein [Gemmatimonas aurantiaca]|nr:PspC domain-containing protein [Gemmatimonas aurantiaca]
MKRRFYRSRDEKVLAGVCGGMAEYFSADPTLIRLGVVLLFFASGGTAILAYILAIFIVPKEPFEIGMETAVDGAGTTEKKLSSQERKAAKAEAREAERQLRRERREERERNRSTFSKILPGALLVVFGLLFMSKNFYWWNWGDLAPMALIFIGAYFILRQWDMKKSETNDEESAPNGDNDGSHDGHNGQTPELSTNGGN